MGQTYWENVAVGDSLEPFVRKTGLMEWNRFAAANEEHFEFHMDDKAAKAMGLPGVLSMGNFRFAYLHNLLEDFAGEEGDIKVVGCSYRGMNLEGDTLTAWGKVIGKEVVDGEHIVELEVGVKNQDGRETAPGHARVTLPARGG